MKYPKKRIKLKEEIMQLMMLAGVSAAHSHQNELFAKDVCKLIHNNYRRRDKSRERNTIIYNKKNVTGMS